jgi:hypothetical protein
MKTKYKVINVKVTTSLASNSSHLTGKMYRVEYIEESRKWWQLKPTVTTKQAYKRPYESKFRNSEDGSKLSWEVTDAINNYIDCKDL